MKLVQQKTGEPANMEDNRNAFWSEVQRIAVKGAERPGSLTHDEIGRICRVALVGMMARTAKREPQG